MLTATSGFKTNIKSVACYSNAKFDLINTSGTTAFDSDDIIRLEIFGSAIQNGKVLGNLAQHSLTIEVHGDVTASINMALENRIEPYIGVYVTSAYEYIKQQSFIVTEVSYSDTTNITKILATDYLVKLNKEFIDTNTYPMTLKAYLESVLTFCGLSLENATFLNSAFSVASRPFLDYTNCKEIVSKVAELGLCYGVINKTNDKFELRIAFRVLTTADDTLNKDQYYDVKFNDHNFGTMGINTLVLKISQVDGENTTVENATNVAIDGAIEVVIEDNDFINTQALRESVDNAMFAVIDGKTFNPYTLNYRGFPYHEIGDVITITKMDNSTVNVPIFETNIKYNGGLKGQLSAKTLNKSQTSNKYISSSKQRVRKTEIRVDKVESDIVLQADEITILTNTKEDVFYKQATAPFSNNLVNGDFASLTGWAAGSSVNTIAGNTLTNTGNGAGALAYAYQTITSGAITGHKYYFSSKFRVTNTVCQYVRFRFTATSATDSQQNTPVQNQWYTLTGIATGSANGNITVFLNHNYVDAATANGKVMECYNALVFDLTNLYGVGNEPTQAEFELIMKRIWLDTSTNTYKSFSVGNWKPASLLAGAKYVFDGTNATFYNGGLIIKNNAGTTVMTATTGGDIQVTGEMMVGKTSVNAGLSGSGTASTSIRIWAGSATPSTGADFYVRDDGYMKANKGVIGGWTIDSTGMTKGTLKLDSANTRLVFNSSAILSVGGSTNVINVVGNLSTNAIYPSTNGVYQLGTTTYRWVDIWCTDSTLNGSDIRLKKDIKPIEKGIDLILKLKPVQYKWKEKNRNHYGLIANQVKEVFDELGIDSGVYADPSKSKDYDKKEDPDAYLALRYGELIAPMIQTIQSLNARIVALEGR